MKNCLYTILFGLISSALSAQSPVLHRSNYFSIGDQTVLYHKFDISLMNFSPGPAGENVLWDFSEMDFDHPSVSTDTFIGLDPVGTPFYPVTLMADYSEANFCLLKKTMEFDPSDEDYNYYIATEDSIAFIGHWADGGGTELWEDHCPDPIRELEFPFAYPDQFTDVYRRYYYDMSGSDDHYMTGTNTVVADGYGAMITPDGELLEDVLRIHSTRTVRDSNALFGITEFTLDNYKWYAASRKGFILSLDVSTFDSSQAIDNADYQRQSSSVAVKEWADDSRFGVFPNPNTGNFHIQFPEGFDCKLIEVVNVLGQVVQSMRPDESGRQWAVLVSQPGVYAVNLYDGRQTRTRKVVVR